MGVCLGRLSIQESNHRHRRLLRSRRERPRDPRAAEQRDELASFQLIQLHPILTSQDREAGYRISKDPSGRIEAILQPPSRCRDRPTSAPVIHVIPAITAFRVRPGGSKSRQVHEARLTQLRKWRPSAKIRDRTTLLHYKQAA